MPAALTAWGVTAAGIAWGAGLLLAACCAALGAAWWLLGRRGIGLVRVASAGVIGTAAVGMGFGIAVGLRCHAVDSHELARRAGTTVSVTVVPTETARPAGTGRLVAHADLIAADGRPVSGRVVVLAPVSGFGELTAGRPATFRARVSRPRRHELTVATLTAIGRPELGAASAVHRAAAAVRTRFAGAAREVLPADQAAILPGLVLGDTTAVTAVTTAQFRAAGLTHLTAVSGANVTVVCGAVLLSAGLIGPRIAILLAGAALAAFVMVVGPSASVARAAVMGGITLLAMLSTRRRQAVPALAASVIVLMLLAPHLAVDIGFALSVCATAALALLAPAWSRRLVARGWPKPPADAVSVAVAAQLVTAPLIAAVSGRFSLVAVLANLAVAVTIPPITVLGTAAAALCPALPGVAGLLIRFTGPLLWWLLTVARVGGGLPGATVPVPAGWAGLVVVGAATLTGAVLWRRPWFRWVAAAAAVTAAAWSVAGMVGGA